ncbi:MAG: hypothetical protein IJ222_06420 [Bacteroidales bacterium]|nr:hypothetical protein [Bacteroidales bacterium]
MMKALFIGTDYMGLYKDIVAGLEQKGYEVDFIPEDLREEDPDYRASGGMYRQTPSAYARRIEHEWKDRLSQPEHSGRYDLLFVLDGVSIHPCVFEILKGRNPGMKAVNYLFDTVRGIYPFDKNFRYFERIATFDREEAVKFNIAFLPIYWVDGGTDNKRDDTPYIFSCGAYQKPRFELFKLVREEADKAGVPHRLNIYAKLIPNETMFLVRDLIRRILHKPRRIPIEAYRSDMTIHAPIPPEEYRALMAKASLVVDTNAPHQDGLTARFMWALGAGKKIVTNNKSVKEYDFYDPAQILIVEDASSCDREALRNFMLSAYQMPADIRRIVDKYRLDNWLDFLLQ